MMNRNLRTTIGLVGLSLGLLTISVGAADALTETAGLVGISDHDGAAPREPGEGKASGDENPDRYRDSEVDDDESDAKRDPTLSDIDVWNVLGRFKQD